MFRGYIKLWRKIDENPIAIKPAYLSIWLYILRFANHKKKSIIWNNKKTMIEAGSFITSSKKIAKGTGVPESTVRRILNYLESELMIEQQTTKRFRLITVINYQDYNDNERQNEQQMSNKLATNEQQTAPTNNDKELNNIKENEERSEETSDVSYEGVDKEQETFDTKKKTYEKIGLPYKPSPREQKQIDAAEAMKLIDYFKQKAYEQHGMTFRTEDKSRRERIQKQARDFYVKVKENGIEIIDWFLSDYGEWCHYDVDQCFTTKTIERWENRVTKVKDMTPIVL